jgi:hypothetical protein
MTLVSAFVRNVMGASAKVASSLAALVTRPWAVLLSHTRKRAPVVMGGIRPVEHSRRPADGWRRRRLSGRRAAHRGPRRLPALRLTTQHHNSATRATPRSFGVVFLIFLLFFGTESRYHVRAQIQPVLQLYPPIRTLASAGTTYLRLAPCPGPRAPGATDT